MPFARVPLPAAASLAVAVVVGGAGVLGGCQSGAMPTASGSGTASTSATTGSPSPSSSPSPSTSPSVEIPAAAREKSDKGAEAFVRYFFDQVNVAWTTPRAGLIAAVSDGGCQFCSTTEGAADALTKARQKYLEDPVTVRGVDPLAGAPEGQKYLYVDMIQNRVDIVDADGKVVTTDKKKTLPSNVAVIWAKDSWRMLAVEQTP
jgi:Family of unknown function (DUF6318)